MKTANRELKLAAEFIRDTGCNLFLTGRAGTGKTTFLHTLKKESPKRLVVTAPTGVAAINAGGVTLHSFFQLPFGPFLPGSETVRHQYRFSKEKIHIIRNLDLLVIDEISMVRADLLDGVDSVLRRYRRGNLPFGGVQLLMIGDLFQLPPVVKEEEWGLLHAAYASPYFFSSTALGNTEMVTIELQHIYRQADSHFIDLLNRVRGNRLDQAALKELNARHIADFTPTAGDGYITLGTHNRIADTINGSRLGALPQQVHTFEAEIEGDFPEHTYPTAATLDLKTGAQVMFVRNDSSPEKRYFNGKIGTITRFTDTDIRIRCPGDSEEIAVEPATWDNIDYTLDQKTLEITENRIGAFRQYPLRLAWAITIHKSQGLTFDRAIIDAKAAFAYGQVYVALSRCRTFEGMVLSTPLSLAAIKTDPAVLAFSVETKQNLPSTGQLKAAKIRYQQQVLLACFDFQLLRACLHRMVSLLLENAGLIRVSGGDPIRELQKQTEDEVCTVGDNFLRQLRGLFSSSTLPASDALVLERVAKASAYFQEKIAAGLGRQLACLQIDTDNKALRKKVNYVLNRLQEETVVKLAAVQSCEDGFSPSRYLRAVSAAGIDSGKKKEKIESITYGEADIAHPELFQALKDWRSRKADEEGIAPYRVLHQRTLIQIAVNLPDTPAALKGVKGIGNRLMERYGQELVATVGAYRRKYQIKAVTLPTGAPEAPPPRKPKPKAPRIDTRQISLELFEKGMTLAQVAEERGLVLATIEGHMAHWVESGKVAIDLLLPPEKRQTIEQELSRLQGKPFGQIKHALGADVSFGEIKLVQAHRKHLEPS
ncbi:helix-turn-helix domain-containing protein [Desulfosarcina sp.]|uniref:helix-turn-helix domain-containing protein n=1 Tax=Desulfosarcina sp. TaxID=2027861 RepID=UPI0029A7D730|nr:helix-turn-helix domain-containing protein [Desulfosarcina sp.]MDX2452265.1 helix-turn-helix domain-containing protein [Desulfosarcina sp.]MDX2490045.1 helix-turn-helix domain-containing protein [Desulfosarcina sp.]